MSTDPFARHGIKHISPSSLRLFRDNLAVWIGRYLLRVNDEAGPKAWRGQAVEAGLDHVLFSGGTEEEAARTMELAWAHRAMGLIHEEAKNEFDLLPAFLKQATLAFKDRGTPLTRQSRIDIRLEGIEVPMTGFIDYFYSNPDRIFDLKTTHRVPSAAVTPEHCEQMSAYMMATGAPCTVIYCSSKKWSAYDVTPQMAAEGYERLLEGARAMRAFLAHVENARDALSMVAPDYSNFYFTPPMVAAVKAAKSPPTEGATNGS